MTPAIKHWMRDYVYVLVDVLVFFGIYYICMYIYICINVLKYINWQPVHLMEYVNSLTSTHRTHRPKKTAGGVVAIRLSRGTLLCAGRVLLDPVRIGGDS
jgi:hypothetical protein